MIYIVNINKIKSKTGCTFVLVKMENMNQPTVSTAASAQLVSEKISFDGFKLVDGEYTVDQASDILLNLVCSKITFHNNEIFSLQERFGTNSTHSVNRIAELKKVRDSLIALMSQLKDENVRLRIDGDIKLKIVKD